MHRIILTIFALGFTLQAQAFPCFITLVKDNCWTDYDVTVTIIDGGRDKELSKVTAPRGKSWDRVRFDCEPLETISLKAVFSPVFWEADLAKVYSAHHNWLLPEKVVNGGTAWNIPVCYPADFAEIPLPPNASGNCKCDMDNIPAIKPQ